MTERLRRSYRNADADTDEIASLQLMLAEGGFSARHRGLTPDAAASFVFPFDSKTLTARGGQPTYGLGAMRVTEGLHSWEFTLDHVNQGPHIVLGVVDAREGVDLEQKRHAAWGVHLGSGKVVVTTDRPRWWTGCVG